MGFVELKGNMYCEPDKIRITKVIDSQTGSSAEVIIVGAKIIKKYFTDYHHSKPEKLYVRLYFDKDKKLLGLIPVKEEESTINHTWWDGKIWLDEIDYVMMAQMSLPYGDYVPKWDDKEGILVVDLKERG